MATLAGKWSRFTTVPVDPTFTEAGAGGYYSTIAGGLGSPRVEDHDLALLEGKHPPPRCLEVVEQRNSRNPRSGFEFVRIHNPRQVGGAHLPTGHRPGNPETGRPAILAAGTDEIDHDLRETGIIPTWVASFLDRSAFHTVDFKNPDPGLRTTDVACQYPHEPRVYRIRYSHLQPLLTSADSRFTFKK